MRLWVVDVLMADLDAGESEVIALTMEAKAG
jgi:predicted nucleic acid-binding protein